MLLKSLSVLLVAVVVSAQHAAQFPAGVNPVLCPDYPNCDNSLLHTGIRANWYLAPTFRRFDSGSRFPPGIDPAICPNYPYCDNTPFHHVVSPLPGWTERIYPAGVLPHECPNYPICY